jgi:hypothetical protein
MRMGRSHWKFLLAAVGLAVSVGSANATSVTFDWSEGYFGGGGTFTATADGGGEYTITGITGTMYFGGYEIIALYPANDINEVGLGANDNLLFSSTPQLDEGGFAFETADGGIWQIQYGGPDNGYVLWSNNDGLEAVFDSFNATLVATPLPAALPLFAGSLGVMGLFGWRRKRKAAASLAAA